MSTKFDICTRASLAVGGNPIASFDDGTVEALAAAAIYDSRVRTLLSGHVWTFAKRARNLGAPISSPATDLGFAYAYNLPDDILRAVNLWRVDEDDEALQYEIAGIELHTNEPQGVSLTYLRQVDESYWSPQFEMALEMQLAADFAAGFADQPGKAELYQKLADKWERIAKNRDSQATPPSRFKIGRLKGARR